MSLESLRRGTWPFLSQVNRGCDYSIHNCSCVWGLLERMRGEQTHTLEILIQSNNSEQYFQLVSTCVYLWFRGTSAAKIHSQEREAAQVGITKLHMRNTSESITGSRRKHLVVPSDPIQWKARASNGR